MKGRRGFTSSCIAAVSGGAMMLLSTTFGTASLTQRELEAVRAGNSADMAARAAMRSMAEDVRRARSAAVSAEDDHLTLTRLDGETVRLYVAGGRLYRENGNGARQVVQSEVRDVHFQTGAGFVVVQATSISAGGGRRFITTRGTEVRLPCERSIRETVLPIVREPDTPPFPDSPEIAIN